MAKKRHYHKSKDTPPVKRACKESADVRQKPVNPEKNSAARQHSAVSPTAQPEQKQINLQKKPATCQLSAVPPTSQPPSVAKTPSAGDLSSDNTRDEQEQETLGSWVARCATIHPDGYRGQTKSHGLTDGRYDLEILQALYDMEELGSAPLPDNKDERDEVMRGLRAIAIPHFYSGNLQSIKSCLRTGIGAFSHVILYFPDLWCTGLRRNTPEKNDFLNQVVYLLFRACKVLPQDEGASGAQVDHVIDHVEKDSVRCCAADLFAMLSFVSTCRDVHKQTNPRAVIRTRISYQVGMFREILAVAQVPRVYLRLPATPAWSGWEQRMVSRLIDAEKFNHPAYAAKILGPGSAKYMPHDLIQEDDANQVVNIATLCAKGTIEKPDLFTGQERSPEEELEYERRYYRVEPAGHLTESKSRWCPLHYEQEHEINLVLCSSESVPREVGPEA